MVEAALYASTLSPPSANGRRYWGATYHSTNFNSTIIRISDGTTNPIFAAAQSCIGIDGVAVRFLGALAGITGRIELVCGKPYFPIADILTTAADELMVMYPNIVFSKDAMTAGDATYPFWFNIYYLANYAATDDCFINVWGWIDTPLGLQQVDLTKASILRRS